MSFLGEEEKELEAAVSDPKEDNLFCWVSGLSEACVPRLCETPGMVYAGGVSTACARISLL